MAEHCYAGGNLHKVAEKDLYFESNYAECHYAECHYANCRGAVSDRKDTRGAYVIKQLLGKLLR
jgi:hypothetical protein